VPLDLMSHQLKSAPPEITVLLVHQQKNNVLTVISSLIMSQLHAILPKLVGMLKHRVQLILLVLALSVTIVPEPRHKPLPGVPRAPGLTLRVSLLLQIA